MKALKDAITASLPSQPSVLRGEQHDRTVWMDAYQYAVTNQIVPQAAPKNLTATEIKARQAQMEHVQQQMAREFDKMMDRAITGGVIPHIQRYNDWSMKMRQLPAEHPAVNRLRAIRGWEYDRRIETHRDVDLCTGAQRVTVTVMGLKGAVFTEREDQFPSEDLFARVGLAVSVAPAPPSTGPIGATGPIGPPGAIGAGAQKYGANNWFKFQK